MLVYRQVSWPTWGSRTAGLTVAVLFGVFLTSKDGPAARAFRHAPACAGETNLATCAGDFTAVINGVRALANGALFVDVSYATDDGAINTWVRFDGDPATIVHMTSADENARTSLGIRVWRRSIVGAELGGSWHWAQGDPPGNTIGRLPSRQIRVAPARGTAAHPPPARLGREPSAAAGRRSRPGRSSGRLARPARVRILA